ncbi:hypothetical protein [Longimicrobium sp.]|uniref:hypothetical protein n=1 Tax=Longimicrobium sp. TaxID=2029185 RepID=UPI002E30C972|nr:hypothetical protein [Longimicrobium sp.]HEX6042416.1 hypothetical protein [Longimicrobium sp.]
MMQLVGRMAPFCLRAAVLILLLRGRTAVPVASQLVDLLFLLILLAAVDQWLVVPLLRGLGKLARFLAGRRGRPEALQKPPSLARLNQPPGPGAPDEEG